MLPVPPSLLGTAYSLTARIARGEVDLEESTRERVQTVRNSIDDVSDLVGNLSPDEPSTWVRFAGRVMDEAYETHGRAETTAEWRRARGFDQVIGLENAVAWYVCESPAVEVTPGFDEGDSFVMVLETPDGLELAVDAPQSSGEGAALQMYRRAETPEERAIEAVAEAFWAKSGAVRVGRDEGQAVLTPVDLERFEYRGDNRRLIDRWRRFLDRGMRRNILLQGPPGTGKTTLCCHAARELGGRTLLLTGDVLGDMTPAAWSRMLSILAPSVVIVDDIERQDAFGPSTSGSGQLRFFSEGRENVPLVLFTANDHKRLPAAVRRPGRIDEIVEFEETSDEVRGEVVRQIAAEEGAEVPADRISELVELMEEYSGAHVREAVRRAKVFGWEEVTFDGSTFLMHREFEGNRDWRSAHGFEPIDTPPDFILEEVAKRTDVDVPYETGGDEVHRLVLPTGAEVCWRPASRNGQFGGDYGVRRAGDDHEKLYAGVARVFWRDRDAILLDSLERNYAARELAVGQYQYFGPHVDLVDRLREFRRAGLRRSLLLQGKPGTGKSTLCMQMAHELAERCLFLTPECFRSLRAAEWDDITRLLRPDMVVVDDVDRVGALESRLRFFEDRHCDIPFVLFTSNDLGKLPDPMKRPGRIDQVVEIEPPGRDQRRRIIDQLAERVGVQVPDERRDRLDTVFCDQSPAHVREMLRRAKTLGWDRLTDIPGDRTFEPTVDESGDDAGDKRLPADAVMSGAGRL